MIQNQWSLVGMTAVLTICLCLGIARAVDKVVTVGYQLVYNPWNVAIVSGEFESATGYDINWRKFDSGSKVLAAMAAGDVQIALAGSSPIVTGVSRGLDLQLFWIAADIASAEALVVRHGSGIVAPQDLKGKRLAVPFVSTAHLHVLFALEQFGIDAAHLTILNMQPSQIEAAWLRGDIDAAFVWGPVLNAVKQTGHVLIASDELNRWGQPTFDGMVVDRTFAETHGEFMVVFVRVLSRANAAYRDHPRDWTPDSDRVRAIVEIVGGNPEDVPLMLARYAFPSLKEQASCLWLGCRQQGGAARALQRTARFLKDQKKIPALQPDYSKFVTSAYVEAALKHP